MTAEQLEELLSSSGHERWVRGFNDYGNPVARLNYGGIYGTSSDGFKEELDLLLLAPSLARRVIELEKRLSAAEKLVDLLEQTDEGEISGELYWALQTYREASK